MTCQALQQEKHVLLRKLEVNELASGQREAELVADLAAAKAELERHHSQGRDRRRDESGQLTQLANHNQRLVEQLSEVSLSNEAEDVFACSTHHLDGRGGGGMQLGRFRCGSTMLCLNSWSSIHTGRDAGTLPEDGASLPQRRDGRILIQPQY